STQAVQSRDLRALFATLNTTDPFLFITPSGRRLNTLEQYRAFHENFFADRDWDIEFSLVETWQNQDAGWTLGKFEIREKRTGGETSEEVAYFTLFYQRLNGAWRIVADICTPINP
ncbi:MAG: nuclear transport factor 2 family protein, partial [Candidatus Aminicenantes bacterium]|nr:nuclear transport factor 2 family protein [Candidatus Aminicenantes bacterium]